MSLGKELTDPPLRLPQPARADAYRFHAMVKPSGSQCNLECRYCYYLHKQDLLGHPKVTRMSKTVLEAHIRQYIAAQTGAEVVFSWQGGEPTLMGLDFFRSVVALQGKYRKAGQRIENDLQTNGVLLDEDWCAFLQEHRFLVGLSLDGPADLHDVYRQSKGGQPTFAKVMRAVGLLHQWSVPFNVICVVNRVNARKPTDTYRFLRDHAGARMIQFIPGLEPIDFAKVAPGYWDQTKLPKVNSPGAKPGNAYSVVTEWSVDPNDWGYFLTRVWAEWLRRDFGKIFVDQFENVISQMFGAGPKNCTSAPMCGNALAIEHNGDIYSCDHFAYSEYKLGNIGETHEGDLAFSPAQQRFAQMKSGSLPAYCKSCSFLSLCWGECPKNRFIRTPDGQAGLNYLCPGLKAFYAKVTGARDELQRRLAS